MSQSAGIDIRTEGRAGRITLCRPQTLNALTYDMVRRITPALEAWRSDPDVALVIIEAEGERAFCAGGDLEKLYRTGISGDLDYGRQFWRDEYRLNALIADYPKPYVAFMQGFVMGGGVGIGCHGSHRIVGDTTRVAMPECLVGLIPDVGGTYLLSRSPGRLGEYLGLTGDRMQAADAILAGFADYYLPEDDWADVKAQLIATGDVAAVQNAAKSPEPGRLGAVSEEINALFDAGSALQCVIALENSQTEFAAAAARNIRKGCPLSVACTFELLKMARQAGSLHQALRNELRFTWRSMTHGEFLEGVRAQIIDKDRKPVWKTGRLEDIAESDIRRMLAPLKAENLFENAGEISR